MRVYYTGDMANQPGWFTASPSATAGAVLLIEDEGGEDRSFTLFERHIGHEYHGHCDPRFVTGEAYDAYRAARMKPIEDAAAAFRARRAARVQQAYLSTHREG